MNKNVFNKVNAIAVEAKGKMVSKLVSELLSANKQSVDFGKEVFILSNEDDEDFFLNSVYVGKDDYGEDDTLRLKYHLEDSDEIEDVDMFDLSVEDIISIAKVIEI